MGKSQEMRDRKGQDDLMSVMIERLKKDPGFIEFIKIILDIRTVSVFSK
jgi:hypothetical protein